MYLLIIIPIYLSFCSYSIKSVIHNLLQGGYPARLKKVLIVTAPMWFKAPFKVMRLFVREKLRDRVSIQKLSILTVTVIYSVRILAYRHRTNAVKKCGGL